MNRPTPKRIDPTEVTYDKIIATDEPIAVFEDSGERTEMIDHRGKQFPRGNFYKVESAPAAKRFESIPEPIPLPTAPAPKPTPAGRYAKEPGTVTKIYEQKKGRGVQVHSLPAEQPYENQELVKRAESPRYHERWVKRPTSHEGMAKKDKREAERIAAKNDQVKPKFYPKDADSK